MARDPDELLTSSELIAIFKLDGERGIRRMRQLGQLPPPDFWVVRQPRWRWDTIQRLIRAPSPPAPPGGETDDADEGPPDPAARSGQKRPKAD
jgi:hypothetical protein